MTRTSNLSRRLFLRGAAGTAVALPFLGSLQSQTARGQFAAPKRFVAIATRHGGVWPTHMYPGDEMAPNAIPLDAGWTGHWGDLSLRSEGGMNQLSPFMRADSSQLTPAIAEKMMMINGLDAGCESNHNWGAALGNNFETMFGERDELEATPSIDQVMAWSDSFYPDASRVPLRSIHLGESWRGHLSWGYENPAERTGALTSLESPSRSSILFAQLFPGSDTPDERPLVVDRVLESYRRLTSSSRISRDDRRRLEDHMQRIDELQRRLNVRISCDSTEPPEARAEGVSREQAWDTWTDLIAMAFMCGSSQIATIATHSSGWVSSPWSESDWHQTVAHLADNDENAHDLMVESHRNWFTHTILALANKLDVEEAEGRTYLDNSLLMYTSECGPYTHHGWGLPVITIGSAGGYFNTGRYYDYRNREDLSRAVGSDFAAHFRRPGLVYNQWLANILMSMGLQESEWASPDRNGYGSVRSDRGFDGTMRFASDPLPMIRRS